MAVQAQYPSNVLLLNRNGQDQKNLLGSDYMLQPQLGGFLDQSSHMYFNNGVIGVNPRKRNRETVASAAAAAAATSSINLFSLQSQPQTTLVNLAQLHNQQPNGVSTGLRLSFGEQQQQQQQLQQQQLQQPQQQQQQQQQQQEQQSCFPASYSSVASFLSEELAPQMKQQREEIEQFIHAQGEQLRRTLAERRQRHYRALLSAAEESASRRLRQKEAEVEKAVRLNTELEQRVAQLRMEAQVWEAKARAQEATAATLQAQLQQAMMSGGLAAENINRAEDAESGGGCEGHAEDAESAHIDPDRVVESRGPMCKACWKRSASVVLLPCRHLCMCTACDAVVNTCPLCYCPRSDSVEVFLS